MDVCITCYLPLMLTLWHDIFDIYFVGQLRHVMDERKLLSLMNSRFVLKLHGKPTI